MWTQFHKILGLSDDAVLMLSLQEDMLIPHTIFFSVGNTFLNTGFSSSDNQLSGPRSFPRWPAWKTGAGWGKGTGEVKIHIAAPNNCVGRRGVSLFSARHREVYSPSQDSDNFCSHLTLHSSKPAEEIFSSWRWEVGDQMSRSDTVNAGCLDTSWQGWIRLQKDSFPGELPADDIKSHCRWQLVAGRRGWFLSSWMGIIHCMQQNWKLPCAESLIG